MQLSRWVALIAVFVGVGTLQVSQRSALFLKGYALGDRMHRVQMKETDVAWLGANVVGLSSPRRLADIADERRLTFVAWSTFSPMRSLVAASLSESPEKPLEHRGEREAGSLAHLASLDASQPVTGDDEAD